MPHDSSKQITGPGEPCQSWQGEWDFLCIPQPAMRICSPVILGLNSKIEAAAAECCYFFHMILSLITIQSQVKNLRLLMDVLPPGASCNTLEKFRTCSICLLKSWAAAMLKMCTRKGHERLEGVDAYFKHIPMKMWFPYSSSVLLTHQKGILECWNIGHCSNLFLNCAIQLWRPNCSQIWFATGTTRCF